MKYLFVVQGEGRGHLTQAISLSNLLRKSGHKVVEVLVSKSYGRVIPEFFEKEIGCSLINYFDSLSFICSKKNKSPNFLLSFLYNIFRIGKIIRAVDFISRRIINSKVDVVVNFYDAIGSWGFLKSKVNGCKAKEVCIGHQYLFLHKDFNMPLKLKIQGALMLNMFSRLTSLGAYKRIALSFREMGTDTKNKVIVAPPLLRQRILNTDISEFKKGDYILGYIANDGYAKEVLTWHEKHPNVNLHFFWDKKDADEEYVVDKSLVFHKINDDKFIQMMKSCRAFVSTAGFEAVCEAMFMGKALMVVPIHLEQKCNAFDVCRYKAAVAHNCFDLSVLLNFEKTDFTPEPNFAAWVKKSNKIFLEELENC